MSTMLYRYPGKEKLHGDFFDYIVVEDDELKKELNNGWCKTTFEAKELREALEAKAKANNVTFTKKITTGGLYTKIQEAIGLGDRNVVDETATN